MSEKYHRKVIHISGTDSPNVRLALAEIAAGKTPSNRVILPGVLPYEEYKRRLDTWDKVRICIGIEGKFWEGAESLMYPPAWLARSHRVAAIMQGKRRKCEGIGIDPGEGSAETSLYAVDKYGVIGSWSRPTPDTNQIVNIADSFIRGHGLDPDKVCIDRGGGGKQLADRLRARGMNVRTVFFNEPAAPMPRLGRSRFDFRIESREKRYTFKNRRAEMYWNLRQLMEPPEQDIMIKGYPTGFGIPEDDEELVSQLSPIPLLFDAEGRVYLPSKNKRSENSTERTLIDIIGRSPDRADALVLAVHAMIGEEMIHEARVE